MISSSAIYTALLQPSATVTINPSVAPNFWRYMRSKFKCIMRLEISRN
jgi:hypothetical protein